MNDEMTSSNNEIHWIESESLKENHHRQHDDNNDTIIENNIDDDDIPECYDMFADPDPMDTFSFCYQINDNNDDATSDTNTIEQVEQEADNENVMETRQQKTIRIILIGYKQELGQTLHSTGLTLWRASELLCQFMLKERMKYIENKKILELGSGLGLCGILASKLYAHSVILTDGDTDTIKNLRINIQSNCDNFNDNKSSSVSRGNDDEENEEHDEVRIKADVDNDNGNNYDHHHCNVQCQQLIWGNIEQMKSLLLNNEKSTKYDIILGSDIIYVEEIIIPLFDTVSYLLEPIHGQFLLSYARRNVSVDLVFNTAKRYGFVWEEPKHSEGVFIFRYGNQ